MLGLEIPVDPDAETARRWLTDELADSAYQETEGLIPRILRWISELFSGSGSVDLGIGWLTLIGALVVAVVVAIALVVAGPLRRARRARTAEAVLGETTLSAQEWRERAAAAARSQDHATAVLDAFRALVRSLEERALLDERPGRTAAEAAHEAEPRFPAHAPALHDAGRVFDEVCYGDRPGSLGDYERMAALDATLADERPAVLA
ncbi:hypothetical protein GCM10011331_25340 [Flavimobilis marinus]|uniref:Protein-glutamine gamma-glutamyltransferase-like C-terminal domain-containing protein n=1 Tax=Flavimobilis marinus TaxID=285351 RepID=A0A1I2HKH7_9MICO|nr:DUF4129 domain-containing protein [Flavimobilis marinus]GHG57368.1 hypothetical protein GCM10011331_25340 [Flavimobilis marinus]SFF29357.1 protein of unknown function [Flavimobilis marinus]